MGFFRFGMPFFKFMTSTFNIIICVQEVKCFNAYAYVISIVLQLYPIFNASPTLHSIARPQTDFSEFHKLHKTHRARH